MFLNRIFKWAAFSVALLALGLDTNAGLRQESKTCMGVQILTEAQVESYTEHRKIDLSEMILYNGEPAAVDTSTSTVYLSQNIREGFRPKDLSGKLTVSDKTCTLYFTPDEAFDDLAEATEKGHGFTLLVTQGEHTYTKYQVVFTTLPVLRLDGSFSYADENKVDVLEGKLCLWAPNDPETGRYSVKSSTVQWHVRGGMTTTRDKQSWKLALKNELGENNDLSFLGMGEDDDWILNAMVMDDTKQKEKLFMQLWNNWADIGFWNYKMSVGEYVEVVRNKSYSGVYLLQRRVDRKYYRLTEDDILLKGGGRFDTHDLEEAYEIVYSPLGKQETLALMEDALNRSDCSMYSLDNFVDINLFLLFGSAADNMGVKNMFYLLNRQNGAYTLSMIPWDTDLSWGVLWVTNYEYHYERSMNSMPLRREYEAMQQRFPELDWLMALRWKSMREEVLSTENVLQILEQDRAALTSSGAFQRDKTRWGQTFGGEDTTENLFRFVEERLLRLDQRYQ